MLVDKSMPAVVAHYNMIPPGEGGGQRGPGKTLLFDIAHGLAHRVRLTKLVELDGDIHMYLTTWIVAALAWVGEALVMLEGIQIMTMTRKAFDNMLLKEASHNYEIYR